MTKWIFILCLIPVALSAQFNKREADMLVVMANERLSADAYIDSAQTALNKLDSVNYLIRRGGGSHLPTVRDSLAQKTKYYQDVLYGAKRRLISMKSDIPKVGKWKPTR